jgi:hypothetical protein
LTGKSQAKAVKHLFSFPHIMPEVPPEILLYISSFIPNDELVKLVGVNIHFYNLALDIRYRVIRVETVNATTDKLLHRLRYAFNTSGGYMLTTGL